MKCVFEYSNQRDKELLAAYRQCISEASYPFKNKDILEKTVNMPCSRFWVDSSQASKVIHRILSGDNLDGMRENKRAMFFDLFKIVMELKKINDLPIRRLCEIAVDMPAQRFYLKSTSAKIILHHIRKKEKCKKKRLSFLP